MKTSGDVALKSDIAVIPTPASFSVAFFWRFRCRRRILRRSSSQNAADDDENVTQKNEFVLLPRSIRQMLTIFSGVKF